MLPQVPRRQQRTEPAADVTALMSANALKSKSILSVPRLLQQQKQEQELSHNDSSNNKQQLDTNPKSQPNQLKTSSSPMRDIFVGVNVPHANTPIKVYAAAVGNIDAANNALVKAYPTQPPPPPQAGASSLFDASIVLRIPTTLDLSGGGSAPVASLHATSLAPTATTCEPLARVGAIAIVGPEMLATNRPTCRTACSLIRMTPASALGSELMQQAKELEPFAGQTKYLADSWRWWPAPIFIVLVSLLEIFVFSYDYITNGLSTTASELLGGGGGSPVEISITKTFDTSSVISSLSAALIYRPDRRLELWRFVSYMLLHANWLHLCFNVFVQMLCGLPLELVHGSLRVGIIYLAGVFAGSLGTSIVDSQVYLLGASGGVYALLTANLANILLNYEQMRHVFVQLLRLIVIVSCDLCYACYRKYNNNNNKITNQTEVKAELTTSYIAHLTGALAGFTVGLLVLKNFNCPKAAHAKLMWWLALSVYAAFTIFTIAFNLINTVTAQILEEKGEVMEQQLLNNLGFS